MVVAGDDVEVVVVSYAGDAGKTADAAAFARLGPGMVDASLRWDNLMVRAGDKVVLNGVSGCAPPGALVALMGCVNYFHIVRGCFVYSMTP